MRRVGLASPEASRDGSDSEVSDCEDGLYMVEEQIIVEHQPLGHHIFDVAIAFVIRDWVHLFTGNTLNRWARLFRLVYSVLCALACLVFQVYLSLAVYHLLCTRAVNKIRSDYSSYELAVYGAAHVKQDENGHYHGLGEEFFNVKAFHDLPESTKHELCSIPLVHETYTFSLLFIWTLTCVSDARKTLVQSKSLLLLTPTVTDLHDVFDFGQKNPLECAIGVVQGLTLNLKCLVAVLVLVPKLLSVMILCFLGCRWLLATNDLSEIFLNALALEFMLGLKSLLYEVAISARARAVTEGTKIVGENVSPLGCYSTAGSLLWAVSASLWVYVYMYYLQQVLPAYQWDVRKACATWEGAEQFLR
eukprot:TRINITY_DN9603_c0_g1_i1.p1 TRINITY_DN9603_c0_g1~~TRINITY_DN9603_c0_g1_i1.p1  ORF type:complete len:361 (+),score=21.28 TRINITY_DN9603_c0_g1_i1:127-1209(+)